MAKGRKGFVDRKTLYKDWEELWAVEQREKEPNKTKIYTLLAQKYGYGNHMNVYHAIRRIKNKIESVL